MMSDFNVKITVRNGRLLRAIREKYGSAAAMARAAGIPVQHLSALVTMRERPFKKDGGLTSCAEMVVSALGIPADDLWPEHLARLKARRASVEIEMDAADVAAIGGDGSEALVSYRQCIARWSRNLTDKQVRALTLHLTGATLDEVGAELGGVTRERARQIIARAEALMRQRAKIDGVTKWEQIA